MLTDREVVERYSSARAQNDLETMEALRHPDWTVVWPQSGELVRGSGQFAAILERYPGGRPRAKIDRIIGNEDRWVATPNNTVLRVAGTGDFWSSEWSMTYPDGQEYRVVDLIELREGRVYRETVYWAVPFEAPAWRQQYVVVPDAAG
jgi:hypothetical protein